MAPRVKGHRTRTRPGFPGMSDPPTRLGDVGQLVELAEWRARREARTGASNPVGRLDAAVARLDALIGSRISSGLGLSRAIEGELLAIAGAVSAGLLDEAAARAGRLADQMEHPAASGH